MTEPIAGADQRALASMANQLAIQQREIELIKMGRNQASLGFSSIEDGSLVIYDADGNVRNVIGKQDDGSYVGGASPVALDPPEVPNTPEVSPGFGTLMVVSKGSSDPPWPRSFSHLNVYLSSGTGAEGDPITEGVVVGTIIGTVNSAFVIAGLDPKPYRVWLTSVGIDTAESDASTAVTAIPTMVVGQDILDGAITELKLANDAVTEAKLAAASVGTIQIQGESIDVTKLADGSVDGSKIIANAIAAGHLAAASVTSIAIAAQAIQAENIAVGAIQAGHLAADSVTAANILALSIQADHLASNAVTAGKIDAGAIRADHLQAGIVIADASFETGTSGRRVVISGPGNEIRFFPQLNETAYGRIFSYVSDVYPEDVNIEMRAIDSDEVNVQPRMIMTPDSFFAGLTDRGDDTVNRGGRLQLEESVATIGVKTNAGVESSLYFYSDGGLKMKGFWENYSTPDIDDAIQVFSTSITNNGTGYLLGIRISWRVTMISPFVPIVSCGTLNLDPSFDNITYWSVRDSELTLSSFGVGIGNKVATSPSQANQALQPNGKIGIRAWFFRIDADVVQSVAGDAA
ncbi:MAG TPA: hypothetical protein VK735_18410 [Pseudonocardia sp.]|uniref:hypothetical protein n=1 Tax=Pseudonocardia sp. TaxID=60912 RepID=UPI002BB9271A|nr:hypothetical protein [Pseudonocardia sp.]HTF49419.1 hypothetical protein [Pseudonocardia sp.]